MSPAFYHIAHLVGFMFVLLGFGALLGEQSRRTAMRLHGIGLVIMLVAGFGLIAKLGLSYSAPWVIAKMVIWLALGVLPVLSKRGVLSVRGVLVIAVILAGLAASMGYLKQLPFAG
jgi:hypothetical protein